MVWVSDPLCVFCNLSHPLPSFTSIAMHTLPACVTTKARHLNRLGQLSEFEQNSNTESPSIAMQALPGGEHEVASVDRVGPSLFQHAATYHELIGKLRERANKGGLLRLGRKAA